MPGVVVRIARESSTAPMGYETLVEADCDNTKVEIKSTFFSKSKRLYELFILIKIRMNQLKVNY
jgi:hypothetical protein